MANVLIIDDVERVSRVFSRAITRMGHQAEFAFTLREGLRKLRKHDFDLVLLDVGLPDGNGLDAVSIILKAQGEPEVIIITGQGDAEGAEMAVKSGAWTYVEKPPVMDQLVLHIKRALQFREQKINACRPLVWKNWD
jgi:DNA-binding NtrC family response regulator